MVDGIMGANAVPGQGARTFQGRQRRMIERQNAQQPGPGVFPGGRRGRQLINQTERQDVGLGQAAGGLVPEIQQAYQQPFDTSQLPQKPWEQGQSVKDLQQQYYDEANNMFSRTADPQFQRQLQSFDEEMTAKGIPIDSEKYKQLKADMLNTQEGQRQNIRSNALMQAADYGGRWNDIGTQNFQNAYEYANAERNRPLAEYGAIKGMQSGIGQDYLDQAQQKDIMQQQFKYQKKLGGKYVPFRKQLNQELRRNEALNEQNRRLNPEQYQRESPYPALAGGVLGNLGGAYLGSEAGSNWLTSLFS